MRSGSTSLYYNICEHPSVLEASYDEIGFFDSNYHLGLNWYRSSVDYENIQKLSLFSNTKIKVPSLFISGEQDWGTFQKPGAIDKMSSTMSNFRGIELVENAGHWVQQENSEKVNKLILDFLSKI